jgi:hypothetical protein
MRPTTLLGIIFAIIGVATLLGIAGFQYVVATEVLANNRLLVGTLGLAWMFGVWGTLMACMVFAVIVQTDFGAKQAS